MSIPPPGAGNRKKGTVSGREDQIRARGQMEMSALPSPSPVSIKPCCLLSDSPHQQFLYPHLLPRPHPSFTAPSITRPHFSIFSPSLPLCSAPCCVSECYGEPRDRARFILVKKYLRRRVPQQQVSMARHLDTGKYGIKE